MFLQQNILVQRIDPSIRSILGGFALDDEVLERIANSNISYGQLSALDNDDLNSLGITDHETQEEILAEFRSLENQDVHLEA